MVSTKVKQKDARKLLKKLKLNINDFVFRIEDLTYGMNVELEHGTDNNITNVTSDNYLTTGKIALAHLMEYPDYYRRLQKLEEKADEYWKEHNDITKMKIYKFI